MIWEWIDRGYNNTMKIYENLVNKSFSYPDWFGNKEFHASHRSNLLRKDPEFYGKYGWTEPHDLPYIWPL
jgi:hypothetical protein